MLTTYAPTEEAVLALARADTEPRSRPLLQALRARQAELLARMTTAPVRSDHLLEDIGGIACQLNGVRFLLDLVKEAQRVTGYHDGA